MVLLMLKVTADNIGLSSSDVIALHLQVPKKKRKKEKKNPLRDNSLERASRQRLFRVGADGHYLDSEAGGGGGQSDLVKIHLDILSSVCKGVLNGLDLNTKLLNICICSIWIHSYTGLLYFYSTFLCSLSVFIPLVLTEVLVRNLSFVFDKLSWGGELCSLM